MQSSAHRTRGAASTRLLLLLLGASMPLAEAQNHARPVWSRHVLRMSDGQTWCTSCQGAFNDHNTWPAAIPDAPAVCAGTSSDLAESLASTTNTSSAVLLDMGNCSLLELEALASAMRSGVLIITNAVAINRTVFAHNIPVCVLSEHKSTTFRAAAAETAYVSVTQVQAPTFQPVNHESYKKNWRNIWIGDVFCSQHR